MLSESGNKISYSPAGPWVVLATDFDAQRLRADTAEAELKRLDSLDTMQLIAELTKRIASHESTLRHFANCADVRQVGTIAMDYVAALNPKPEVESHE